jgi:hypothetical protein
MDKDVVSTYDCESDSAVLTYVQVDGCDRGYVSLRVEAGLCVRKVRALW